MFRERDGDRDQPADQRGGDDGGCGLAHGSPCAAIVAEPLTGTRESNLRAGRLRVAARFARPSRTP